MFLKIIVILQIVAATVLAALDKNVAAAIAYVGAALAFHDVVEGD